MSNQSQVAYRSSYRRRFHSALSITIILLGAFLLSVLVAWGASVKEYLRVSRQTGVIIVNAERYSVPSGTDEPFHGLRTRRMGFESWIVERPLPHRLEPGAVLVSVSAPPPLSTPPRWVVRPPDEPGQGTASIAYGWPLRCVMFIQTRETIETATGRRTSMSNRGMYMMLQDAQGRGVRLAYIPIWSGLVANTLVFAASAALILGGLGPGRRILRARRGQCVCCGYDLLGQNQRGCPECGWDRRNAGRPGDSAASLNP